MDRRVMIYEVNAQVFADMLRGGFYFFNSEIPDDAEYISTHYEYSNDMFYVKFRSEFFDEVPEGSIIPRMDFAGLVEKIEVEDEMSSS